MLKYLNLFFLIPVVFFLTCHPKNLGHHDQVQDQESIFTDNEKNKLELILNTYRKDQNFSVSIVTTESIEPDTSILSYAIHLGNKSEYKNKDILLAICQKQRTMAIATSRKMEKILTDSICKEVIDSIFIPHFKNDKYFNGVHKGVEVLLLKRNYIRQIKAHHFN